MTTTSAHALQQLSAGQPIIFGGDRVTYVDAELADAFRPGDRLVVVQTTGALLHIPAADAAEVDATVRQARIAFTKLAVVTDDQIAEFFARFADALADDRSFAPIAEANAVDVESARGRGRSTTRLELTASMRDDMIRGLRSWITQPSGRDQVVSTVAHERWRVETRRAPLGVVGFVFEGRPNVFADAAGVVRSGNAAVFRIGSDALGTARSIVRHALEPALRAAGLPEGVIALVDAPSHAAGWALFAHPELSLAVARGSGSTVAQLGAVARQSGTPVSLHGTGGAWLLTGRGVDPARLHRVVRWSLDRKVCNTLNVVCILREHAVEIVPVVLDALCEAGASRSGQGRLHVVEGRGDAVPPDWFEREVEVVRADGVHQEPHASWIPESGLATEWEWEGTPELTLCVVDDLDQAISLFGRYSPRLVASVISDDPDEFDHAWATLDAPFVGDGFTRWVDGQFALGTPELGLSNWEGGRLFGRSGVLSGDGVHTVRLRAVEVDRELHR